MGETDEFDTLAFEKRLTQLKDTQESIQALSSWCLKQRQHHKKIVQSWLNVLKIAKIDQRLVLFYLANDVIQYSKRKGYEFVESWGLNLQKATPLVRDEKVRHKILRIFKIWEQRSVYDDEFLSDLTGLLSVGATKKTDDDNIDFQPQQLVNKIKQCTVLETDTDMKLKNIHDCGLQLHDADELCANLKDRSNKDDVEKELNEGIGCVERYTAALQREIVAREALLALLTSATRYYATQRGEVKVVAYAYKNFGARVRALKRKLDELLPNLPPAPSPPRPQDVPSPTPDEDIDLPNDQGDDAYNIDKTFNTSLTADGSLYNMGLSSFLNTSDAMAIFNNSQSNDNGSKIEVINIRPNEKQDFDLFLKNFVPNKERNTPDNVSVASATLSQKSQDALPGLDLLTPDSAALLQPPNSFYGSIIDLSDEQDQFNVPNSPWNNSNNSTWNVSVPPPAPVPPPGLLYAEPPASPPAPPPQPAKPYTTIPTVKEVNAIDVDHRSVRSLPPPPPPPALPILEQLEDVDHRLLPTLPPPPPPPALANNRHNNTVKDVDHRNLISLTHQPPPAVPARNSIDQDYRVPPPAPGGSLPPDIVESVDMDLSEDEDPHHTQPYEHEDPRRNSNNKVLVGGNNGKVDRTLRRGASVPDGYREEETRPLTNPFENMPNFSMEFNKNYPEDIDESRNSNDSAYDDDLRNRGIVEPRNTPPYEEEYRPLLPHPPNAPFNPTNRFPRNWTPRGGFQPRNNQPFYRGSRPWQRPPNRFW